MSKFAELPDGTKLEFPDDTQDTIIDSVVKKHLGVSVEEPSQAKTFAKNAVENALPTLGAIGAGGLAIASLPATAPALATLGVGVGAGFLGGAAVDKLQGMAGKYIPEDVRNTLGFDKETREAEDKAHPYTAFAGRLAPSLAAFRPGALPNIVDDAGKVVLSSNAQRAGMAGIGSGLEAGVEYMSEGKIDPVKVAMAGAFQGVAATPTWLGKKLMPTAKSQHEPQQELPSTTEMAVDKAAYTQRRLDSAQFKLAELQTTLEKTHDAAARKRVEYLIEQQASYVKNLQDDITKLDTLLGRETAGDERPVTPEQTNIEVQAALREMDSLDAEYRELNRKGAAKTAAEKQRLEEIQTRFDELSDFTESHAAKLFGEDTQTGSGKARNRARIDEETVPNTKTSKPMEEVPVHDSSYVNKYGVRSLIKEHSDGDWTTVGFTHDTYAKDKYFKTEKELWDYVKTQKESGTTEFTPGKNRVEVNQQILGTDLANHSDSALVNMLRNKQSKIEYVQRALLDINIAPEHSQNLHDLIGKLRQEFDHINTEIQRRTADPKATVTTEAPSAQLQAAVKNNNLRAGLEALSSNMRTPWVLRKLASHMLKNEAIGKFIKLHYDNEAKFAAQTSRETGDITFRTAADVTQVNYLHEAVHSATSGMLLAYGKGQRFSSDVNVAISKLLDIHKALSGRYKNQFLSEYRKVNNNADVEIAHVLANERELLAYAQTDAGVMTALNAIQWRGKSYATELIDSVAKMFGWTKGKERSMLESIFEVGDVLIANSNGRGLLGQNGVDAIRQLTPSGDIGYHFGNKLIDLATNLPNLTALRMLNLNLIKGFWPKHKYIQDTVKIAETANRSHESRTSFILHGHVSAQQYKNANIFQRMNKMEAPDGLLPALSKLSFSEVGQLPALLYKAARDGVELSQNLARYGADTLSAEQKHLLSVIETTKKKMFDAANRSLESRGLPPIKSWGPGYIPSHVFGNHFVEISYQGVPLRREWYMTKTEAERAGDILSGNRDLSIKVAEKQKDTDYESIDTVLREAIDITGRTNISLKQWISAKLEEIELNNSAVGAHKQHKDLVRGFSGDKHGRTEAQQGQEFAHSLEQWVHEYSNAIRKREIEFDLAQYNAQNPNLVRDNPNAAEVVRYLAAKELNQLESPLKGKVSEAFNTLANETFAKLFPSVTLSRDVIPYAYSLLTRGAYNYVLTSAPVVWVTQALGSLNAQRMYFKGDNPATPLEAMDSAFRGLHKVLFKQYDDELMQAMHYVSQNFETLHKHLTNEISEFQWHEDKQHITNKIYRFVSGETFTSNADAISRMITFAQAIEHLKKQGKSGKDMWKEAASITEVEMGAFGHKNLAGLYDELGGIGTMLRPLKHFIHQQGGKLATDVKDMVQQRRMADVYAFSANMLGMMITGGVIGLPFMADYEYLRQKAVEGGMISYDALPNWTTLVEGMDPVFSRGIFATTGIDMGASMRYQSILKPFGDIVGADGISSMAFPLSVGSKVLEGAGATMSDVFGDIPQDTLHKAQANLLPRGIPRGMYEQLVAGDDKITIGKRGQMLTEKTPVETAARYIGSRSVEEAHQSTMNRELDVKNKSVLAQKQRAVDLYLSGGTGDQDAGLTLAKKLIAKNEWTTKEFVTAVKNLQMSKMRPINEASVLNNKGNVSKSNLRNYMFLQQMENK